MMIGDRIEKNLIRATYRITTPMFCGGAEQQAEFRLPSFKGVLRFWWRALEWGRIQDLAKLQKEEAELFGSSDAGQSRFLMRLDGESFGAVIPRKTQLKDGQNIVGQGARYLGYGVMEAYGSSKKGTQDAELIRPCYPAGGTIKLAVRFGSGKSAATDAQRLQVERALKLTGLLGGIGSKARKGYGSLTLSGFVDATGKEWPRPNSLDEFRVELSDLLRATRVLNQSQIQSVCNETPLTAFSRDSRIVLIEGRNGESTMQLLDRIGRELVRYRSWGREGKVLKNIPRENGDDFRFRADHDLMRVHPTPAELREKHPQRIAFGLPHNYGPKSQDQVSAADTKLDRRASPLFIHIHEVDGSPPLGVLTFLPAMFLPAGRDRISVGGKNVTLQTQGLWQPVEDFLDRLLDKSARKEFSSSDRIEQLEVPHG